MAGLDQWRQRLDAARARHLERLARSRAVDEPSSPPLPAPPALPLDSLDADADVVQRTELTESLQRRVAEIDALRSFVERLARDTDPGDRDSWAALSRWARRLLDVYLGGDAVASGWSEAEQRSRVAVLDLLDALAPLDELDDAPGIERFARVVEHELSRSAGRVGRFGHGVFVGRLVDAVGADLDEVIVLGGSEGVFPPRPSDDPLLPDRDRRSLGDRLRRRGSTPAEEERDALAVMASARSCTLTFPVADPRDQRVRQPSPFVLDQCSSLLGERVDTDDAGRLRGDARSSSWFVDLPSFEWWLADGGAPATPTGLDVDALLMARAARNFFFQVLDEVALVVDLRETVHDRHAINFFVVRALDVATDEKFEDRVSDFQQIAVAQRALRDLRVVHIAAVGRTEIRHLPHVLRARHLRVATRN